MPPTPRPGFLGPQRATTIACGRCARLLSAHSTPDAACTREVCWMTWETPSFLRFLLLWGTAFARPALFPESVGLAPGEHIRPHPAPEHRPAFPRPRRESAPRADKSEWRLGFCGRHWQFAEPREARPDSSPHTGNAEQVGALSFGKWLTAKGAWVIHRFFRRGACGPHQQPAGKSVSPYHLKASQPFCPSGSSAKACHKPNHCRYTRPTSIASAGKRRGLRRLQAVNPALFFWGERGASATPADFSRRRRAPSSRRWARPPPASGLPGRLAPRSKAAPALAWLNPPKI